jgi:ABC-type multidrug transport system fused ATPase/permease subunit
MGELKERLRFYKGRIREGRLQEMWRQTLWIYQYARKYWKAMIFYTALGMVGTVISLFSGFVSRDLVDIITGHKTGELIRTFSLLIGVAVGNIILNQITGYISSRISMKVDAEIKQDVFEKILVTDWESLTNYHTGDLLTRWGGDAGNISSGVLNFVPNLIITIFRFLSALYVVLTHDASFAIFAMLGIPVSLLMSRRLLRRMQNNNKRSAAMGAKMSGFNQETFSNIQTIKAFDLVRLYVERLRQLQREYIDMRLEFSRMSMVTSVILGFVGLLVSYSSYGWGIYRVWSGAITYGSMTMFLSLSSTLTGAVNNLTAIVPSAISLTTSAGRLMDILDMPREEDDARAEAAAFLERHREAGVSLLVRDLDYAYRTGTRVFSGASFEAHPHEIVGLVGPSGEGKTTMLRLLLALVRPEGGEIALEGEGERFSLCPSIRQAFSYVPQGNTLFSGTVAENLRSVKPEASEEELRSALELACAWDFISRLPEGVNSPVKERGGGFSEGQAQRLAIARALLRRSPILLLDEASSALDVATERQVLKNIMRDEYPRVCIVTTHRPTVLTLCTRVYRIRDRRLELLTGEQVEQLISDF